jgi:hypothetical protein
LAEQELAQRRMHRRGVEEFRGFLHVASYVEH